LIQHDPTLYNPTSIGIEFIIVFLQLYIGKTKSAI